MCRRRVKLARIAVARGFPHALSKVRRNNFVESGARDPVNRTASQPYIGVLREHLRESVIRGEVSCAPQSQQSEFILGSPCPSCAVRRVSRLVCHHLSINNYLSHPDMILIEFRQVGDPHSDLPFFGKMQSSVLLSAMKNSANCFAACMALALGGFRVIALSLSGKFGQIEVLRKYGTQALSAAAST